MPFPSRAIRSGAVLITLSSIAFASPRQPSGAELQRALERFAASGSVLYVAAHPDDENTRLLSWLVSTAKVRAAYLSLTRGEGGQNLIGQELSPLLGAIRTEELLAARAIDGAEQLFGNQRDFGYSKSPEETLRIWNKPAALGDVVWAIRRFRPDVIVTRFSPEARDTHGHHTASAMLALEAFRLAADPKAYPEQLAFVQPWQARRIVWNKGVFGAAKPGELDGFQKLDIGAYDPLLGTSAGEVAARSRSMHKSQGFGASPQRGPVLEYFKLLAGEPMPGTFLDGVERTWRRIPGSDKASALAQTALQQFRPADPAASVPLLLDVLAAVDALPPSEDKLVKHQQLVELIVGCMGLVLDAVAATPTAVPGGELKITATVLQRSKIPLQLSAIELDGQHVGQARAIEPHTPYSVEKAITIDAQQPLSTPYWLGAPPQPGRWAVTDQALIGQPRSPAWPRIRFDLVAGGLVTGGVATGGRVLSVERVAEYAWNDPVIGERRRPIEIVPAVVLQPATSLLVFADGASQSKSLEVTLRSTAGAAKGRARLVPPSGYTVEPSEQSFELAGADAETKLTFRLKAPSTPPDAKGTLDRLRIEATLDGGDRVASSLQRLDYGHLPMITVVEPAEVRVARFALRRGGLRLGYIPGAGDEVAAALRQAGYDVTILSDEALLQPLASYDAIVIGIRAFNVNRSLGARHDALMRYVEQGGTLVVQYSTNNRLGKLDTPIGPWPFSISQERVTEEQALVERGKHPVLEQPNPIDDQDFVGWVQERGLYFAGAFDEHYAAPLSMHDAGEPARRGGLLVGEFGKGRFVYTGLAFFRQLPAGVPGAFRLFANLLAGPPKVIAKPARKGGKRGR